MSKRTRKRKIEPSGSTAEEQALKRYRQLLNEQDFAALLDELQQPLRSAIRLNKLKTDPKTAIEGLGLRYGWQLEPVNYCETGWWISKTAGTSISKTIEHRLGQYYIQDAASMLPVELFSPDSLPAEAPLILDMAASPGGKTTHLVDKIGDSGLVVANDSSRERLTALRLVLQTWGAINAVVTQFPGEKFGAWYPDTFDRVLLDAPCSMENLRSTESHPMRPISPRERSTLAQRQAKLLESAFQAVRVGGQVVYSTCTLAPEEDEAVLDILLKRYPGAVEISRVEDQLPFRAPGLTEAGGGAFDPTVSNAVRLWPHTSRTSGFFAALITKTRSLDTPHLPNPVIAPEKTGFTTLPRQEKEDLIAFLMANYGFDLEAIIEKQNLALWQRGKRVFVIPEADYGRLYGLPVRSMGLLVGESSPAGFVVSYEWCARFAIQFERGHLYLEADQVPRWLRGEDLHGIPMTGFRKGEIVIVCDESGRMLSRGKVLSGRLRNLLPRRLVLR
jgi:16S rRNA (cytosine1407-C5)-methyltransferase